MTVAGAAGPPASQAVLAPPTLGSWAELVRLVQGTTGLHVPRGRPRPARGGGVHDEDSGCVLPGLPVLSLTPEPWWPGSVSDWAARQLAHHLGSPGPPGGRPPGCLAVLRGDAVGRGWDGEVLLDHVQVVALLSAAVVAEGQRRHSRARSGRWPAPQGDVDWIVLS